MVKTMNEMEQKYFSIVQETEGKITKYSTDLDFWEQVRGQVNFDVDSVLLRAYCTFIRILTEDNLKAFINVVEYMNSTNFEEKFGALSSNIKIQKSVEKYSKELTEENDIYFPWFLSLENVEW